MIKIYDELTLLFSQTLTWGLAHGNPQEISLNVGEIQRTDILVKTKDGWCITAGRPTLKDPPVVSAPIPSKELKLEILITGKNFSPIVKSLEINFPDELILYAGEKRIF